MPMYKVQIHIDLKQNIEGLKRHLSKVEHHKNYTALTIVWWAENKNCLEGRVVEIVEGYGVDWSGMFIKEMTRPINKWRNML